MLARALLDVGVAHVGPQGVSQKPRSVSVPCKVRGENRDFLGTHANPELKRRPHGCSPRRPWPRHTLGKHTCGPSLAWVCVCLSASGRAGGHA